MIIYAALKTQILLLNIKKVPRSILAKYSNFTNIFLKKLVAKLLKYLRINKYAINLELDKQLPQKLIYNLKLVKLEILKTYIKTNLANNFI